MTNLEESESFVYLVLPSISWVEYDKIQNVDDALPATMLKSMLNQYSELKVNLKLCEDDKSFTDKGNLKRDMKIHNGETPFQCNVCSKQFKQKSNLKAHTQIHTSKTPDQCEVCFKKFIRKAYLKDHTRIHTGETPFKCQVCDKQFKRNSHVKRHENSYSYFKHRSSLKYI